MYALINAHADEVVKALDAIGDVKKYLELRRAIVGRSDNALEPSFQRAYRMYWRMNAAPQ